MTRLPHQAPVDVAAAARRLGTFGAAGPHCSIFTAVKQDGIPYDALDTIDEEMIDHWEQQPRHNTAYFAHATLT